MSGNDYQHWPDPDAEPPLPPVRPGLLGWLRMSERDRQQYEAGIAAYLWRVLERDHEEAFWERLVDWHRAYHVAWGGPTQTGDTASKRETRRW